MTTAAPPILNPTQAKYFTQLIQDNPTDKYSQNIINTIKKTYPALNDILPVKPTGAQAYLEYTNRMKEYKNFEADKVTPASITSGNIIILADAQQNTFMETIESDLGNFMDNITKVGNFGLNMSSEINSLTNKVSGSAKQFIGQIGNSLADKSVGWIKGGIDKLELFRKITSPTPAIAMALTIMDQTALISPVKKLFGAFDCLTSKISDALTNTVKDLLTGMVKNVINTAVCAVQQFVGALTSKITDMMDGFLGGFFGPVEKVFSLIGHTMNIKGAIFSGMNMINKVGNLFRCAKPAKMVASHKHTIDVGSSKNDTDTETQAKMDKTIAAAGNANASKEAKKEGLVAGITGGLSKFEEQYGEWGIFGSKVKDAGNQGIGNCNTSNPFACGSPKVEFFGGGGGIGAAGDIILGNFINHLDKDDIYGDIKKTGSIVGVNITSPGEGYTEEPLIAFTDSCRQGYGAYGRAKIDSNINSPTYGQVTDVIVDTEGEYYPTDNYQIVDNIPDDEGNIITNVLDGENSEVYIDNVIIENPGVGYNEDDIIEDYDELKLTIDDGRITGVEVTEQLGYNNLPELNIVSETGGLAVLRPIMKIRRRTRPQLEVMEQIQCIGDFSRGED